MSRRIVSLLALALATAAVTACHGPGSSKATGAAASSDVVASFAGDQISSKEVDAQVLSLAPKDRPKPGEDLEAWYRNQIRDMVVDRRLLAAARKRGLDQTPEFRSARGEAEKQIGLQLCLTEVAPKVAKLTEKDLKAAYESESKAKKLSVPERRSLYQIFLRRKPGALERIKALREQVLEGEGFSRLASKYSESETRHRKGFVGWFVRGQLPAGFEKVVFSLEEGVPSQPISTREGFDLFYVDQILPAKTLSYEEARSSLLERLEAQRREEAFSKLDEKTEPPKGSLILSRDQLAAVVKAADPKAVVLRLGDETWTLGDLRQRVQGVLKRQKGARGSPSLELAWRILEQARQREEIYLSCRRDGHIPADKLASRLGEWEHKALVDLERHKRLVELALQDKDKLHLFYESNIGQFSTLPTWTIRRLQLPLGDHPAALMARLEAAATTPGTHLADLHAQLGGEVDEIGPKSLTDLGRLQPKLPSLIAPLEVGQLSAPFRSLKGLQINEVVARTKAVPRPFDKVENRVAARYVQQYTSELYDKLRNQILGAVDLKIDPTALASLRDAGLPQPDVSVDQLETLLDQH